MERRLVQSAVLVPLYRDTMGELRVVLIRRTEHGVHGGQLAFPGGRTDPTDATPLDTALREAEEEIGLTRDRVRVIESLPAIRTMSTSFRIAPFLAWIDPPEAWAMDPREVAEVLEVRILDLATAEARGEEEMRFAGVPEPKLVPYLRVGNARLWGASYRILEPLLPRLVAEDFGA